MGRIYISGQITGLPMNEVKKKFEKAEEFLKSIGYDPVNPLKISPFSLDKLWEDYMIDDIKELFGCDTIYMLKDWKKSKGARIEYHIALITGKRIIYEYNKKM